MARKPAPPRNPDKKGPILIRLSISEMGSNIPVSVIPYIYPQWPLTLYLLDQNLQTPSLIYSCWGFFCVVIIIVRHHQYEYLCIETLCINTSISLLCTAAACITTGLCCLAKWVQSFKPLLPRTRRICFSCCLLCFKNHLTKQYLFRWISHVVPLICTWYRYQSRPKMNNKLIVI